MAGVQGLLLTVFIVGIQMDKKHSGEFFGFEGQQVLSIRNHRLDGDQRISQFHTFDSSLRPNRTSSRRKALYVSWRHRNARMAEHGLAGAVCWFGGFQRLFDQPHGAIRQAGGASRGALFLGRCAS